jgi:2-desacetyl-2-hydroxyethyl bacteriochlorophyllide A dehydrogenase
VTVLIVSILSPTNKNVKDKPMQKTIRAVVFKKANEVAIDSFPRPQIAEGSVICETRYSLISTGTEMRTLRGGQEGAEFPLVPGYSWVGQVVEVAADVKGLSRGDWVSGRAAATLQGASSTWGGHAEVHCSPAGGYAAAVKLPDGCDPLDYVLTEVASISWRGVSMTCPVPGETALVSGQGLIGALAAKWLILAGARVIAVDMDQERLERTRQWGAWTIRAKDPDAKAKVLDLSGGGVDIAVEASSSLEGAKFAASVLRQPHASVAQSSFRAHHGVDRINYWPRLCLLATYTKTMDMFPTGLVELEGTLVLHPRDRRVQDRISVIDNIRKGLLKTSDIVDAPIPIEQAPETYRRFRDGVERNLTTVFKWE